MILRTKPIQAVQFIRACRFLLAVSLFVGAVIGAAASVARAATIDYGDFNGPDTAFIGVSEDSITDGLPLFDEPILAGNTLVLNPKSFQAFSEDGGIDLTDSTLTMEIRATNDLGIRAINIVEAGDYSLVAQAGLGTNGTFVQVAAPVFVQIIEVDFQSIDPILITDSLQFTPSGGDFRLKDDPNGVGIIWEGHLTVDLDAALAARNIDGSATRVLLNMNNSLIAASEPGTIAFIKKKAASIGITPIVPEPSGLVLAGLGLFALVGVLWRRRRRE